MQYRVTKQFERGPESTLHHFRKREEAASFVEEKLADDAKFKVKATYRIYDDLDEVLKEYTVEDYITHASSASSSQSSSSQGAGKSQAFSPTPFNTKPLPGGMPHSWVNDTGDKDKKE